MDGQYVTRGTRRFTHVSCIFRDVLRDSRRPLRTFRACFAHVSRCFAVFREIRCGFAMFRTCFAHVSRDSRRALRTFRACFFRACFAGVKHGECASHTGRPVHRARRPRPRGCVMGCVRGGGVAALSHCQTKEVITHILLVQVLDIITTGARRASEDAVFALRELTWRVNAKKINQ